MNDYQQGIHDLQTILRKHGVVLLGDDGLKAAYYKFLNKDKK